jgi:ABC-type taurine transport system ATPase subunit
MRVGLAATLFAEPDLLLLDEMHDREVRESAKGKSS